MKDRMKDRNCFNEFLKYTSLNVLGMTGLSCYILADTFFISKGLGSGGLAALNLAIPIYSFIHGSGLMLGMGGATRYSILKGQGRTAEADRTFTSTVFLTLAFAIAFFSAGLFLSGKITSVLGADETIYEMTNVYIRVILLFSPIFLLNNILLCFVRNDGAPQFSMMAMLGGSLSNIVLDYIFIFPLHMGMFGAVFATGLAPIISIGILMPFFLKKKNSFRLKKCAITAESIRSIVSGGIPSLVTEVSSGIVMIIFNTVILGLQGNIGVAAYGVIANLSLVVTAIYTGMAQGIQPIISRNFGLENRENVRKTFRYALISMIVISAIVYLCMFFGADPIASIFNREQNEVLQEIASGGMKLYFTSCVFAGFNIILAVYFTSTEQARSAHVISLLRGFLVVIPMTFLLSAIGGMTGVWCVIPASELITAGVGLVLYYLVRRKKEQKCSV